MYFALILTLLVSTAQCSNILGVFMYPSYSHQVFYRKIYRELSLRGYKVTVITTDPLNDPSLKNLTEVSVRFAYDLVEEFNIQEKFSRDLSDREVMENMWEINFKVIEKELNSTEVKNVFWDENAKYDLILKDFMNPVVCALAHKLQVPVVDLAPTNVFSFANDRVGNPNHPVLYPDPIFNFVPGKLNMWQKFRSVYFFLWQKFYYYNIYLPRFHRLAQQYFGNDIPDIADLERNVSMFFINRNFILHPPRPNVPAAIEVSPLEYEQPKPLPKDLKSILDEAREGVIYVSFGAEIKGTRLSSRFRMNMLQAFSELPYKFLLKWESDSLPGKPSNVIIRNWFPQTDVLAHPNVKAFVTHGGQKSIEESLSREVPMVGIPFFADQPNNVRKLLNWKVGVKVNPRTLSKAKLKDAIIKVAETKIFRTKIKVARDILFDRPMTGLEQVVWWSEYVIRHNGARHLRSPAVDMHWFQYLLLDVILVLTFGTSFGLYLLFKIITAVPKLLFRKRKSKKEKTN